MRRRTFTQREAQQILERHGPTCYWCRAPLVTVVIDHYVPFKRGGRTTVENGVPSCVRCNQDKHDMMPDEYRAKIEARNARGRDLQTLDMEAPTLEPIEEMPDIPDLPAKEFPHRFAAREAEVRAGLLQLDPDNDDHWNKEGKPRRNALFPILGWRPVCMAEMTGGWAPSFNIDRDAATVDAFPNMTRHDKWQLEANLRDIRQGRECSLNIHIPGAIPNFNREMARALRAREEDEQS